MGYYTRFTGEIRIEPPLTWGEFKDSPFLPADRSAARELKLDVDAEVTETDEGTVTRRYAMTVLPLTDEPYKGYEIVAHLQELVDSHPGHEFVGTINAYGEESGDVWRLRVVDRRVVKETARLTWPDGTEEPVR